MAANTGRTHAHFITVKLDNSGGTLTDITPYVNSVGTVGKKFEESDVTAYSDGVKNIVIGQAEAPLAIGGPFDTVIHAHMIAINGALTPLSLDIQVGIRQSWQSGEPQYGITSSATSGYLVSEYLVDLDAMKWSAKLNVMGSTSPEWGTSAEV